jgi:hypothetical protein
MNEKWTLAEGIKKLLPTNKGEEPEISDLGLSRRQLVLDVSIAEGGEEGNPGISVILGIPDYPTPEDGEEFWDFTCFMRPRDGESFQALVARIAQALGIAPDERVWEDGEQLP